MIDPDRIAIQDLIQRRRLNDQDVNRAARHSDVDQITLADALIELGLISARDFAIARARVREVPFVDLDSFEINPANAALIPTDIAKKFGAFTLFSVDGTATVGMADPADPFALDRVQRALHAQVDPVLCEPAALAALIDRHTPATDQTAPHSKSEHKKSA